MTITRRSRPGWPETLRGWGCWEEGWEVPTSGGITQARQRLGPEPLAEVFAQVAVPVGGAGHGRGVPGAVAADVGGRDGVGRPGHAGEPGRVRVPGRGGGPGGVPEGPGGDGQRVRLARGGGGRDGPGGGREGQRGAGPGPAAVPAAGGGLAADRRPELLLLGRTGAPRRVPGRRCCGGSSRACGCRCWSCCPTGPTGRCWSARGSTGQRPGRELLAAARPRRGPGRGPGPVRAGDRVRGPGPGRATARTS